MKTFFYVLIIIIIIIWKKRNKLQVSDCSSSAPHISRTFKGLPRVSVVLKAQLSGHKFYLFIAIQIIRLKSDSKFRADRFPFDFIPKAADLICFYELMFYLIRITDLEGFLLSCEGFHLLPVRPQGQNHQQPFVVSPPRILISAFIDLLRLVFSRDSVVPFSCFYTNMSHF